MTEEIITRCYAKKALLLLILKTLKNACEEVHFSAKLRRKVYNFTKNELLSKHFSDDFT